MSISLVSATMNWVILEYFPPSMRPILCSASGKETLKALAAVDDLTKILPLFKGTKDQEFGSG